MRSAVVLVSSCVVDIWSWLPTLLESQFRECENKTISVTFLYASNKPALPGKTAYGLVWSVNCLHPLIRGRRVCLSLAPFTGYGVEMNDISDCVWTFTFIRRLIKEVYISLLGVGRKGHNEQTLSFSMKWCVVWLSHLRFCGTQSRKTIIIKMIFCERFSLRRKRFQSGFCAKVRAGAKKGGRISKDDWRIIQ